MDINAAILAAETVRTAKAAGMLYAAISRELERNTDMDNDAHWGGYQSLATLEVNFPGISDVAVAPMELHRKPNRPPPKVRVMAPPPQRAQHHPRHGRSIAVGVAALLWFGIKPILDSNPCLSGTTYSVTLTAAEVCQAPSGKVVTTLSGTP